MIVAKKKPIEERERERDLDERPPPRKRGNPYAA